MGFRLHVERTVGEICRRFGSVVAAIEATWSDGRYRRSLILIAAASLWLALALREPLFLALFGLSCACIWWCRRTRADGDDTADDW